MLRLHAQAGTVVQEIGQHVSMPMTDQQWLPKHA